MCLHRHRRNAGGATGLGNGNGGGVGPTLRDPRQLVLGGLNHPLDGGEGGLESLAVDMHPDPSLVNGELGKSALVLGPLVAVLNEEPPAENGVVLGVLKQIVGLAVGHSVGPGPPFHVITHRLRDANAEQVLRGGVKRTAIAEEGGHVGGAVPPGRLDERPPASFHAGQIDFLIEGGVVRDNLRPRQGVEVKITRMPRPHFRSIGHRDEVALRLRVPGVFPCAQRRDGDFLVVEGFCIERNDTGHLRDVC